MRGRAPCAFDLPTRRDQSGFRPPKLAFCIRSARACERLRSWARAFTPAGDEFSLFSRGSSSRRSGRIDQLSQRLIVPSQAAGWGYSIALRIPCVSPSKTGGDWTAQPCQILAARLSRQAGGGRGATLSRHVLRLPGVVEFAGSPVDDIDPNQGCLVSGRYGSASLAESP